MSTPGLAKPMRSELAFQLGGQAVAQGLVGGTFAAVAGAALAPKHRLTGGIVGAVLGLVLTPVLVYAVHRGLHAMAARRLAQGGPPESPDVAPSSAG